MAVDVSSLTNWLRAFADTISEQAAELTELDAAIGDADHGTNMKRGMQAVTTMLDDNEFETTDALLKKVGMTLVSSVGGASGPLYGTFFLRAGAALVDTAEIDAAAFGAALRAGVEGMVARGKAEMGDKTLYDAWAPALAAYDDAAADGDLGAALSAAAAAAAKGRDETTAMVARKGRASYLGDRSAGHQDPGATSSTLLLESAVASLA